MDTDDSFTKGPWTIGESCALKNALFVYLQTNGIDSSEALNFVASTAKEKNDKYPGNHSQFLVELYRISGLNRSLTQIACHLKVKLEEQNWERAGDKWTPEEDTRLMELAQLYSRSWARIERALGRKGCRERLRQLETHAVGDYETGHFSKQEQLQFLRGLLVHHHPVSEDIIFPEPEVLQKIEADFVPTRSIISLRKKFENGFRLVWIEAKKRGWTGADDEKLTEEDLETVKKAANPGKFTRDLEIVLLRV
ncbi:hypothetical protein HDU79_002610 [Rhizoclosmatium sp. JEL0117]|nr:hypothetical protein HDU79_002610 [Rhizoclosmatium sp. JEL0117]